MIGSLMVGLNPGQVSRRGARTRACRVGTPADARRVGEKTRRDESRRSTHECVRHVGRQDLAHAFRRTFSPSLRPAGGLAIRSSPPIRPCSIRTPPLEAAPTFTGRRTALPSSSTKTALSRTAAAGTITTGLAALLEAASGLASERNATLAFISGRRNSSGLDTLTLIWTVAFCRLASGEISLMKPSYLRSGKASVVMAPCWQIGRAAGRETPEI